jgi:two-component sensor histidine kinase/HAMP domain-containing protein
LILVTVSVVTVMGVVSWISFGLNRRIQRDVQALRPTTKESLDLDAAVGHTLSIEGNWEGGDFVAKEIEALPWTRRPKLRGSVAEVDRVARTLVLYGQRIEVTDETEIPQQQGGEDPLENLRAGDRVELSCKIDEQGKWIARKLATRSIKRSDKIKGTITAAMRGPGERNTLEIDGIRVLVEPNATVHSQRGPLHRMENATQLALAVQECLAASQELLKERYMLQGSAGVGAEAAAWKRRIEGIEDRILDGYEDFAQFLAASLAEAESASEKASDARSRAEGEKSVAWLAPLEERRATFEEDVARFMELAKSDLDAAQAFLRDRLEPSLRSEILPLVHSYHLETEEALSQELTAISTRASTAAQLAIATNVVGLVVALLMGLSVSRSISRPIKELEAAAREIGRGNLETRVETRSGDEIGVLGASFNRMAADLARTTTSVTKLEQIEEQLRRSLAEKELLLHEVHHRVKNNLQVISSLLALQSRSISDPGALEGFQESQDRIHSMVFVHDQLYRSRDAGRVDLRAYLQLLATHLAQSYAILPDRIRVRVEVDEIGLDIDRAQVCGLIVTELLTNSFKHAFPEGESGEILVSCRRLGTEQLALEIRDDGPGFAHHLDQRGPEPLGLSLVETLVLQIRGTLRFEGAGGAAYRVEFPVEVHEQVS